MSSAPAHKQTTALGDAACLPQHIDGVTDADINDNINDINDNNRQQAPSMQAVPWRDMGSW